METYEEKYKDLVKRLNKAREEKGVYTFNSVLDAVAPELKIDESEDERIRKELIDFVKSRLAGFPECKRFTDWLEKHGKNNMGISEATKRKLEFNLNKALEKETPESWNEFLDKQDEQKPADDIERKYNPCYNMSFEEAQEYISNRGFDIPWTDCDVFVDFRYVTQTVANILRWADDNPKQKPAEWTMDNIEELTEFENAMMHIGGSFFGEHQGLDPNDTFVVKEQAKILLEMAPKQEWSENDERIRKISIGLLEVLGYQGYATRESVDWLKSLRPQNTWKPSDEQMVAIDTAINVLGKGTLNGKQLIKLQEQLKKLREE